MAPAWSYTNVVPGKSGELDPVDVDGQGVPLPTNTVEDLGDGGVLNGTDDSSAPGCPAGVTGNGQLDGDQWTGLDGNRTASWNVSQIRPIVETDAWPDASTNTPLSPMDVDGDGAIELPRARSRAEVDPATEHTPEHALKHTLTHELGHVVGLPFNHHSGVPSLHFAGSPNWTRDATMPLTEEQSFLNIINDPSNDVTGGS